MQLSDLTRVVALARALDAQCLLPKNGFFRRQTRGEPTATPRPIGIQHELASVPVLLFERRSTGFHGSMLTAACISGCRRTSSPHSPNLSRSIWAQFSQLLHIAQSSVEGGETSELFLSATEEASCMVGSTRAAVCCGLQEVKLAMFLFINKP